MDQPADRPMIHIQPQRCILCRLCQVSCPEKVITVDKKLRTWSIRRADCTLCGACIRACPKDALSLGPGSTPEAVTIPQARRTKRLARTKKGP